MTEVSYAFILAGTVIMAGFFGIEVCGTYDELIGMADRLMYIAKDKGKNTAEFRVLG